MSWELNKPLLEQWAERCDFQDMGLLGGEPLIHPEYRQWVKGVREIFPNQKRLSVATGLYADKLRNNLDNLHFAMDNRVRVEFNVHDPDSWDETCKFVEEEFLKGLVWTKDTQSIEPGSIVWPDDDDETVSKFIEGLSRSEPACSLCKVDPEVVEIFPAKHKKIMLKKV